MKKINITTTTKELSASLTKNGLLKSALYTLLICVIAGMLVFSYLSVFSSSFYLKTFSGKYLIGVKDATSFNNTNNGQLLKIEKYSSANAVKVGDEIYYSGNSGSGSGIVQNLYITEGYITITTNNSLANITTSTVIGKVSSKTNFWGYILWFFQSWAGVITLNTLLVAIVVLRLIIGLTTESTLKGQELKNKLKLQNQQNKKIKKAKKLYYGTGLDSDSLEVLSGDYNQNKQMLLSDTKNSSPFDAYRFLLQKVHRVYITKQKISDVDTQKISNCLELMTLAGSFDIDVEYRLTDLILRQKVVDFDYENFTKSVKEFLESNQTKESLLCFLQVIYVFIKTNQSSKNAEIIKIIADFTQKDGDKRSLEVINLANSIKNLIKF